MDETESLFDDLDLSKSPRRTKEDLQFNIAIVTSLEDPASANVREHLLKKPFKKQKLNFDGNSLHHKDFIWILTLNDSMLSYEHLDRKIDADLFIFASRHQSKEGKPSLSVHAPGNFGKAEYGGEVKEVCKSSSYYNKIAFQTLHELGSKTNHEITLETTHHGPLLTKRPCFFIEIGSSEKEWKDKKMGSLMADVILEVCKRIHAMELGKGIKPLWQTALGVGGPHYCQNFNKVQLKSDIAFAHVCAKYNLDTFDSEMLKNALERTKEHVNFVLVDWKGVGEHKDRLTKLCEDHNLELKRIDQLAKK